MDEDVLPNLRSFLDVFSDDVSLPPVSFTSAFSVFDFTPLIVASDGRPMYGKEAEAAVPVGGGGGTVTGGELLLLIGDSADEAEDGDGDDVGVLNPPPSSLLCFWPTLRPFLPMLIGSNEMDEIDDGSGERMMTQRENRKDLMDECDRVDVRMRDVRVNESEGCWSICVRLRVCLGIQGEFAMDVNEDCGAVCGRLR